MKKHLALFGTILVVSTAWGCSSSTSSSGAGPGGGGSTFGSRPVAGPDVDPPADVKLGPDVVYVHGGASVLKSLSDDHGTWTLDRHAAGVDSLAPGKVLVIAGLDAAKVTAVNPTSADSVDVTVGPAAFTDVIQEGKLQWKSQSIDATSAIVIPAPDALVNDPSTTGQSVSPLRIADMPMNGGATNTYTLKAADWTITFTPKVSGQGVDIQLKGKRVAGSGPLGAIEADVTATLHVDNVGGSSGSLSVTGGTLDAADFNAPITGSLDMSAVLGTPAGGQFPKQALIKLPIAVEYPFPCWAGIPCYLSVQANFLIQPSFAAANSTLNVDAHFDISGDAGVTYSGGSAAIQSSPTVMTPPSLLNGTMVGPSVGNTALVFAVQAPRVGLGVGTMSFIGGVKAGVFVDAVNSMGIVAAGATSAIPCEQAYWSWAAHGGGEMSINIFNGVKVNLEHSVELAKGGTSWYSPEVNACKPQ